jgi:hypothetical protein
MEWSDSLPEKNGGKGKHPWGSLDKLCFEMFIDIEREVDRGDDSGIPANWHRHFKANLDSVAFFRPALQRRIVQGYKKDQDWLWTLTFQQHTKEDLTVAQDFAALVPYFYTAGKWTKDEVPPSWDERELAKSMANTHV